MRFQIVLNPHPTLPSERYISSPALPEIQCAIHSITHSSSLNDVVECALKRHGYRNSDIGFGVIYPSDLDAYDREVEGFEIPVGYVEVYQHWGAPDGEEYQIKEATYLEVLRQILLLNGMEEKAEELKNLLQTLEAGV